MALAETSRGGAGPKAVDQWVPGVFPTVVALRSRGVVVQLLPSEVAQSKQLQ